MAVRRHDLRPILRRATNQNTDQVSQRRIEAEPVHVARRSVVAMVRVRESRYSALRHTRYSGRAYQLVRSWTRGRWREW